MKAKTFVVTTWRSGDIHDCHLAADGNDALEVAMSMLTQMAPLQRGDKLDVIEAGPIEDWPEPSRSSHMGG